MSRQAVYRSMQRKMLRYADLVGVPVQPVQEELVPIKPSNKLLAKPINDDMLAYTDSTIYVRKSVAKRLRQASNLLVEKNPRLQLEVVYGYRAFEVQQQLFLKYIKQLEKKYKGEELLEATHRLIAVPQIAGHPTGGAVDIQIVESGKPINMGTRIWEFSQDSFTFSPFIGMKAQKNRQLLRDVMTVVGFAPFDGEWWHFSYGDKEWAAATGQPFAIYEQVEFKA